MEQVKREIIERTLGKQRPIMNEPQPTQTGSIQPRRVDLNDMQAVSYTPRDYEQPVYQTTLNNNGITLVKSVESLKLKEVLKKWFDFCISTNNSFSDIVFLGNISHNGKIYELIYNMQESLACVDVNNNVVSITANNISDVLNQLMLSESKVATLTMKQMMVGSEAPFVKVSGYDVEFLVGRDAKGLELAKRIVNTLNFLAEVPDDILSSGNEITVLGFLINRFKQKSGEIEKPKQLIVGIDNNVEIKNETVLVEEKEQKSKKVIKPKKIPSIPEDIHKEEKI